MYRWFVSFTYRLNPEGAIKFGNLVCSTPDEIFSFPHVQQKIADDHNWSDIFIINWKLMKEIEYMAYESWSRNEKGLERLL